MSVERVQTLNAMVMQARFAYYVESRPIMTDPQYDALEKELKALVAENPQKYGPLAPVLTAVGSDLASSLGTVKHKTPMLSLHNAYTKEDVDKWALNHPPETTYVIECKIDGLSLSCRYVDHKLYLGLTRGDSLQGDDVTAAALAIPDVPKTIPEFLPGDLEIRGEVFITKGAFDKLNAALEAGGEPPYKNQRNLASGSLKLKDVREVALRHLSFLPWQIIGLEPPPGMTSADINNPNLTLRQRVEAPGHMGLEHTQALEYLHTLCNTRQPYCWRVYNREDLWAAIESNRKLRDEIWIPGLGYPIDGLVIKVEEHATRTLLGAGPTAVNWGIAFKFPADEVVTDLLGVTWQVGRTGILTPVGELEPISVSGSTVSRVILNNLSFMRTELGNPQINDKVIIYKGGEVIPVMKGVASRSENPIPIEAPTVCPSCGRPVTVYETPDVVNKAGVVTKHGRVSHCCTNISCKGRMIAHFIYIGQREVMDIEGLGDVLAEQFVTWDIAPSLGYLWEWGAEAKKLMAEDRDAFEATCAEAGFGVAQIRTLVDALDRARTVGWDRWLQGLGIPGVARETSKTLAAHLNLGSEDLLHLPTKLLAIKPGDCEGIGPVTVKGICNWALSPTTELDIKLLHNAGVRPTSTVALVTGDQPLTGYVICITGEFPGVTREDLAATLEKLGAVVKTSVSRKLNLLLTGDAPGASKMAKATEWGLRMEGAAWLKTVVDLMGMKLPENGMPSEEEMEDF